MTYYIKIKSPNKAKNDIDLLFDDMGYVSLTPNTKCDNAVGWFFLKLFAVFKIYFRLRQGDILCLQYPLKKFYALACRLAHAKGAKVITIIHDLGAFRRHKLTVEQENRRLSHSDVIIVHNERMKEHLIDNGYAKPIICLGIFDYLTQTLPGTQKPAGERMRHVAYAGNLARWRNEFLYHLEGETEGWTMDVYGKGFDASYDGNPHLKYHGIVPPNDFVAHADADFGLVWDGSSLDECDGDWGQYLLVNNPHKTSFYLRAGIPVIVWTKAAMAPFVLQHGIGIAINSIRELKDILPNIPDTTYAMLKTNAMEFSERLGSGYYTRQAFQEAQAILMG